jgi:hypothetical protein
MALSNRLARFAQPMAQAGYFDGGLGDVLI